MSEPPVFEVIKDCLKCKNINDVVVFLSDEMKEKIEADYRIILNKTS